jgi:hypothetical protein
MFACLVAMSRDAMPGPNRSLSPAAAACMGSVADNNFSESGLRRLLDESGAGMHGGRMAGGTEGGVQSQLVAAVAGA